MFPERLIQRPKRLIHQEDLRPCGHATQNAYPLEHPAGQRRRAHIRILRQPSPLQQLIHRLIPFLALQPEDLLGKGDIFPHREPRQQVGALENESHLANHFFGNLFLIAVAVHIDVPRRRLNNIVDQADDRGLAAAAGANDRDELPFINTDIDILQRQNVLPLGLELLGDMLQDDFGFPIFHPLSS